MAHQVVNELKVLASNGRSRTVIATIHQPSSQTFADFDQLCLLASGRTAYHGAASKAMTYFGHLGYTCNEYTNPADFFMTLLYHAEDTRCGDDVEKGTASACVEKICDEFDQNNDADDDTSPKDENTSSNGSSTLVFKGKYPTKWYSQIGSLISRSCLVKMRNPKEVKALFFQSSLFALILGALFWDLGNDQKTVRNANGLIFIMLMQTGFQQLSPSLSVFAKGMPLFMREAQHGMYSMPSLFLSRLLVDLPIQLLVPSIFGSILYLMAGFPRITETFFLYLAVVVLYSLVASSAGYFLGCAAPSEQIAQMLVPIAMLIPMMFGGFLIDTGSMPAFIGWFKYFSFFRYAYDAVNIAIWGNWGKIECPDATKCAFNTGEDVLRYLSIDSANLTSSLFVLVGFIICFRALAFISLVRRSCSHTTDES